MLRNLLEDLMDFSVDGTENFVIGVDYGTLSGRAVVVRVRDGKELGSGVFEYPHAVVTGELPKDTAGVAGIRLPGEWALQVPNDYRDVLRRAVPAASPTPGSTRPPWWASPPTSRPAPWSPSRATAHR